MCSESQICSGFQILNFEGKLSRRVRLISNVTKQYTSSRPEHNTLTGCPGHQARQIPENNSYLKQLVYEAAPKVSCFCSKQIFMEDNNKQETRKIKLCIETKMKCLQLEKLPLIIVIYQLHGSKIMAIIY